MRCRFLPLFLLLSIFSAAGAERQWEQARVISQDLNSSQAGIYSAPIGNASVAVPIYRRSNTVVVETDAYRYQWSEVGRKTIILPVNDVIDFYHDGNWFIVLDANHKKHKFALVGMTKKPSATEHAEPAVGVDRVTAEKRAEEENQKALSLPCPANTTRTLTSYGSYCKANN
jgi:hypothetical protein